MTEPVFKLDPDNTMPVLPGWISITEAADILGVSRQHSYKLAARGAKGESGGYKSVRRIGSAHFAVVKEAEINKMKAARDAARNISNKS